MAMKDPTLADRTLARVLQAIGILIGIIALAGTLGLAVRLFVIAAGL